MKKLEKLEKEFNEFKRFKLWTYSIFLLFYGLIEILIGVEIDNLLIKGIIWGFGLTIILFGFILFGFYLLNNEKKYKK